MATDRLAQAVAGLDMPEATVILQLVELLDQLASGQEQLSAAIGALDKLDDLRVAEIEELRLTVRLLCMLHGLETKGSPLVDLIREYTGEGAAKVAPGAIAQAIVDDADRRRRASARRLADPATTGALAGRHLRAAEDVSDDA